MVNFLLRHRALLLIMALSLGLKLLFLWQGEVVNPDSATYIAAAQKHAQGLYAEGLRFYRMPFYPLMLAGVHAMIPNWIYAGQVLTVVPLVLCLWPLYLLTCRLFDHRTAVGAGLLFAVLPSFNVSATAIERDPLFLLFSLTALLYLVLIVQEGRLCWWVSFFLVGVLAILTRVEGVVLPIVAVFGVLFLRHESDERCSVSRSNLNMLVLASGCVLLLIAGIKLFGDEQFSRLNEVFYWGQELLSRDFFSAYLGLMEALKVFQETLPAADLHNNLIETTRHYAPLIYFVGMLEMMLKIVFPTSLIALWMQQRWSPLTSWSRERWILLAVVVMIVGVNLLFCIKHNFTTERYLWLACACLLPWVGMGMTACWQRCQRRSFALLLCGLLFVGAPLVKTLSVVIQKQDRTVALAGKWLKDYDPDESLTIIYNDRRLPLYAGRAQDVVDVRDLSWLHDNVGNDPRITFLAIYVSNNKNENYTVPGFDVIKRFSGAKKTALFMQRSTGARN
ncbi:glycosyltransferase family 39 protein [uncultured Desulfuromonas sp.]|uniref:glycosyltransferase family 39 protein n=1 Tax=uncultured Desulfuromonas sp. TaxID=181013 RepID=UPI002AAACCFE|nr:glycosyltransferase family 39 protein [uncultured Desulfuromonas sp.]